MRNGSASIGPGSHAECAVAAATGTGILPVEDMVNVTSAPSRVRNDSAKVTTPRPANITAARRANELLCILHKAGGIVDTGGSDIHRRHEEVLRSLTVAGENTSAPVRTRMDRRTLNYTLEKLEEAGRIKLLTTTTHLGGRQRFAYLPSVTVEDVRKFIAERQAHKAAQAIQLKKERIAQHQQSAELKVKPPPTHIDEPSTSRVSFENEFVMMLPHTQGAFQKLLEKKEARRLKREQAEKDLLRAQEELKLVKTRQQIWADLVRKVRPGLLKGIAEARLRRLRRSYVTGAKVQEDAQWEEDIAEAIMSAEKTRLYRIRPTLKPKQKPELGLFQFRTEKQPAVDIISQSVVRHSEPIEYLIDLQREGAEIVESQSGDATGKIESEC